MRAVSVEAAGPKPENRYWPLLSLAAVNFRPRVDSSATTVALAITPPDGSLTVPLIFPDAPTPCARAARVPTSRNTKMPSNEINFFIRLPPGVPRSRAALFFLKLESTTNQTHPILSKDAKASFAAPDTLGRGCASLLAVLSHLMASDLRFA